MRPFAILFVTLLSFCLLCCASLRNPASRILEGADTVLEAVCDARDDAYLDNARDLLEAGDVLSAVEKLKMFLMTHGPDREVSALISLLEAQLPEIPNG